MIAALAIALALTIGRGEGHGSTEYDSRGVGSGLDFGIAVWGIPDCGECVVAAPPLPDAESGGAEAAEESSGVPPAPVEAVTPDVVALDGIEAIICSVAWPCGDALRIARCESGPDYIAGFNDGGHSGTFQISPLHAWRFERRGWAFWTDALVVERNVAVAYEIFLERGWAAWSCAP